MSPIHVDGNLVRWFMFLLRTDTSQPSPSLFLCFSVPLLASWAHRANTALVLPIPQSFGPYERPLLGGHPQHSTWRVPPGPCSIVIVGTLTYSVEQTSSNGRRRCPSPMDCWIEYSGVSTTPHYHHPHGHCTCIPQGFIADLLREQDPLHTILAAILRRHHDSAEFTVLVTADTGIPPNTSNRNSCSSVLQGIHVLRQPRC